MPRYPQISNLSPGQAAYVLGRLLAERKIATGDVSTYLRDLAHEITDIEARLAILRLAAGGGSRETPPPTVRAKAPRKARKRQASSANQLNGRYMGYYRQIPKRHQPTYSAIRKEQGIEAAITAMRAKLRK
jgi:hypothetical protein